MGEAGDMPEIQEPPGSLDALAERAIARVSERFKGWPPFDRRAIYGGGSVVGHHGPTILSEHDCALQMARALVDEGLPWEHLHAELGISKWIWAPPHPGGSLPARWRIDLAIVAPDRLAAANLPDTDGSFRFDAFFEFKYASDYWLHGTPFGNPEKTRAAVAADADKLVSCLDANICDRGYVVCFEQCDYGFPSAFSDDAEARHPGLRVRVLRAW
jgi:hypothetical protein